MKYSTILKYLLTGDNYIQIAIRYKCKEKKLEICGPKIYREFMEYLILEWFVKRKMGSPEKVTVRFIHFGFKYKEEKFNTIIKDLKNHYHLKQVKSFGRLIRWF